ncbi:MAG: T9SS type A sorting domain-containing protein [Candidatus Marinimicrobia bacterium]|nr:T9SS type A sorting domain-containing protein [Candidatus Neomarinimicrobiota bacterium]
MEKRFLFVFSFIFLNFLYPQADKPTEYCSKALMTERMINVQSTLTEYQGMIDITYYKIDLDIDFINNDLDGEVHVNGHVGFQQPDSIELDFTTELTVDSVYLYEALTNFVHENNLLKIPAPGSTIPEGYEFQVTVFYHGTPPQSGFGSFAFDWHNGFDHVWTLSEPYGSRTWWPCKDDPSDKADSVDIIITVPENQIVASNGLLVSELDMPNNRKKYHWKESYPICTYLVSLAIYPYTVWQDFYVSVNGDSMPIDFYVYPENYNLSHTNYLMTKDMISLFAEKYGEYPFINEKYGHADFGWGGGMEHQTLTSMGGYSQWLIAHELAHQWWGDLITCTSFHHIWLNEGFARYGEALWEEFIGGEEAYKSYMSNHAFYGPGSIYVENPENISDIFNGNLSYNKAGWVVHMLRHVVGDSTFFEILHSYSSNDSLAYASATTEDFQAVCEDVSGLDLDDFFQQWIYGERYPKYAVSWEILDTDELIVVIEQTQNWQFFHMPVDLRVVFESDTLDFAVDNNGAYQQYNLGLIGTSVVEVKLDPDNWILKSVEYNVSIDEENNLPKSFSLLPVYPNPFNPTATIRYSASAKNSSILQIYDITGRLVETLVNGVTDPGDHEVVWNASNYSSGVYFVRLQSGKYIDTQKIILMK